MKTGTRIMFLAGLAVFFICVWTMPSCGSSSSPGTTPVDVATLDGTTGVPLDSTFQYTFSPAVQTSTVSPSTFFIASLAGGGPPAGMTAKATYNEEICNAENALAATVTCPSETACILSPAAALTAGAPYAICLSPSISYASGSAFEGFTAVFDAQATQCDNTNIRTYAYLMAFHWCTDVDGSCMSPQNHMVSLAGSDDGVSWTIIPEFTPIAGSVPDIVFTNDFLYVFHTQGTGNWQRFNACFEQVKSGNAQLVGTDTGGFVDPSLILSGDNLYLFYLPGVTDGDPAGCATYPCTKAIHSAVADNTRFNSFTQEAGDRASVLLSAGVFADPDIIQKSDGSYILYVSRGQSVSAYTSTTLNGSYAIPGGGATPVSVSDDSGGVPSALAQSDNSVWLFVSRDDGVQPGYIRRGVSIDGVTTIPDASFTTVLDNTISPEFTTATGVGSPSVIVWPTGTWSRDQLPVLP